MTAVLSNSLDPSPPRRPTLARAIAFRFGFTYWILFCLPIAASQISGFDWIGDRMTDPVQGAISVWVGEHILGISYPIATGVSGSGDKTADWVWLFTIACVSIVVALGWAMVDRRRAHDARLRELLRVIMRYTVAYVLFGYGISKLFTLGQFPPPSPARLTQSYGDSSPMGLLWTFMGASRAYTAFSGAGEVVGAALLLFRRTTLLGALVLGAVLLNVVLLNFCYDVPVKINSSHYLAICVYLVLPSLGRLANVVVLNRATQPVVDRGPLPRRWMRIVRVILRVGVTAVVLWSGISLRASRVDDATTWYGGHWSVSSFARDGHDAPAVLTDKTRWRRLRFQLLPDKIWVRWRFMDEGLGDLYSVVIDENGRTMTLTPAPDSKPEHPTGRVVLHYTRVDDKHLRLEGRVGTENLAVEVERYQVDKALLMNRGFHWINETPFNR